MVEALVIGFNNSLYVLSHNDKLNTSLVKPIQNTTSVLAACEGVKVAIQTMGSG